MDQARLLLPLAIVSVLAGCAVNESSSGDDASDDDPGVLLKQYYDVVAPQTSDCTGAGLPEWAAAEFAVPAGAAWARVEATFAGGRVGLNVANDAGQRLGYGAGTSPVVVVLEEGSLASAGKLVARAYACDGTDEVPVRVYATFRSAAP